MNRLFYALMVCGTLTLTGAPAHAQDFPTRPIKWVSPWPPGGTNDILSRMIARELEKIVGKPVVIDNRPGAAGTIGSDFVAKSEADGYTIILGSTPTHATARAAYPQLPYDPLKDFAPITLVGTTPNVLIVRPTLDVKSVPELIAYAKANPGKLNFYSSGIGSSQHLSAELFKKMAGVDMQHIPYKGQALGLTDLMGGRIDVAFDNISPLLPHIQDGKIRALAVTTPDRAKALPDIPSISEAGLPGYDASVWFGVFAPSGAPEAILEKLNADILASLRTPELMTRMTELGVQNIGSTRAAFGEFYRKDITKWSDIIGTINATPKQ